MSNLQISNKKILQFYEQNPHLDIEAINLIFIDLFEKLFTDMNQTMNQTINSQILSSVHELQQNIHSMQQDMSLKLIESKKEHLQDIQQTIQNNMHQTKDTFASLMSQTSEKIIDKTNLLFSELFPKYNESTQIELRNQISQFQTSIQNDFAKLSPSDNDDLSTLLANFETKFNSLIVTVSNASESRLNDSIKSDKTIQQQFMHELTQSMTHLSNHMESHNDFFDKYKNSSHKGALGENNLEYILSHLFQSAEIVNTSKESSSGDFILRRTIDGVESILFENKDYTRNVPLEEVKKFYRDIETQKCHGIFLSQHSGITSKQNFQIEFKGTSILIFLHNVRYNSQTIKTAIDIIDSLANKLIELNSENDTNHFEIPREVVHEINEELKSFFDKKSNALSLLKDMSAKIEKEIQSFDFQSLCKYIANLLGDTPQKQSFILCDICNTFQAHSNKSLAAHKRKCGKPKYKWYKRALLNWPCLSGLFSGLACVGTR